MRPQSPRMLTVVVAVLLTLLGLALIFYDTQSVDFVRNFNLPGDIQRQLVGWMEDRTIAWGALALSPLLLIVGSLVKFI
jgi:FtsH-binding integral membrane protein